MKTLASVAVGLTLMILAYILWRPALRYWWAHEQPPETPHDWEPKMITWKRGVRQ